MKVSTVNRKFREPDYYAGEEEAYRLLPYNFIRLNDSREILVSFSGDFLIVPVGTASRIANRQISKHENLYKDLLSNFIVYEDEALLDILATRYRTKMAFLNEFTALHIFVVTLRCNHTCHYCQVSRVTEDKSRFDISFEDLDRAIHHMFRTTATSITMEFQGGEALLAFEKIQYAVERALVLNQEHCKRITFVICTNATVYSKEILDFCKEHSILISTSLDGPEFIHDSNRKKGGQSSYKAVVTGINVFREQLGHDRIAALMTTSTLSLEHPRAIIDTYIENGFSNIFLRSISPYGFALRNAKKNNYDSQRFLEFYKQGLEYIIELNLKGIHFVEDSTAIFLRKMLTPFSTGYVDLQSPSGLVNSVIVYNYDGYVYASDESRMLAENKDKTFLLGHVRDDYESLFFGPRVEELTTSFCNESLAGCSDCALRLFCGSDPVFNHATQGDMYGYRPTSGYCQKNMGIMLHLLELIDTRGPEVRDIFTNWIGVK
jgi:His-Xaa-Ser system radical SAM maturase HxsB